MNKFFEALSEVIADFCVENDKWITIHPHGEDSEDYRRLKLEDGESPKEAIDRVYKKDNKGKEEKKSPKSIKERYDEGKKELDKLYDRKTEIEYELSKHRQKVYSIVKDIPDLDKIKKLEAEYLEKHKEEIEPLLKEENKISELITKENAKFEEIKANIAKELVDIDINKLSLEKLDELHADIKDYLYNSGLNINDRKNLQDKLFEIRQKSDRLRIKAKADEIGGYTKKLNDLCEFTNLSDISSYPEELQKHIYNNYKQVYDKYPQLKYGGLQIGKLAERTYANSFSYSNVVTLNKDKYSDLKELEKSYANTVEKKFHPQGTDYNSIITHELGHGLLDYITKKTGKTGYEIREQVLKKLKIKQKDVKEYLSEYAMKKPRMAHEFFAEAFAEYMTSKNPRPLAVAFGEVINNIIEVYKLN